MCSKFHPIVCCYGLYFPLNGISIFFTVSANFLAFFPCFNFLINSIFVCFSTNVTIAPQLPFQRLYPSQITKSHSINLLGSFADTHTIRYDNAFATYRSCTMFQSVTAIFIQRTSLFFVFPDYAIDTLRRDALAFLGKVARYLFRGPLLLF